MGRRSLVRERRAQILDAFERCIRERGLQAASIAATAEMAGMDRTLVHHYFGTRAELEAALIERLLAAYQKDRDELLADLPGGDRDALLDYMFGRGFSHPELAVLFAELVSASHRDEATRRLLLRTYRDFEDVVAAGLEKAYPRAPAPLRRQVAYSIVCLAEANAGLVQLGFPKTRRRDARASAEALLRNLHDASKR